MESFILKAIQSLEDILIEEIERYFSYEKFDFKIPKNTIMSSRLYKLIKKFSRKSAYYPSPSIHLESFNKNIISKIFTILNAKENTLEDRIIMKEFFNLYDYCLLSPNEIADQTNSTELQPYFLQLLPFMKKDLIYESEKKILKYSQLPVLEETNPFNFDLNENLVKFLTLSHFYKAKLQKKEKKKLFGVSNNLVNFNLTEKPAAEKFEREEIGGESLKNVFEGVIIRKK